jgi:CubicO group peptidase (beta-lactamase class C family)
MIIMNKNRKKRKMILQIIYIIIIAIVVVIGGVFTFITYHINHISKMTFEDMLFYMTKNNKNAIITVGIIQNGKLSYTLYGENGKVLPQAEHVYEIGSLTKTFTASLVFKAISEGKINLDDRIDKYLELPPKDYYPTIRRLLAHISGYKSHYFETKMVSNFFNGGNDFYEIPTEKLIERIGKTNLKNHDYKFKYSNFGISVVGAVLATVYKKDYATLMNDYIKEELDMNSTKISDGFGDLGNYWEWAENDAYLPAGALTSNIEDMLKYAQIQINELIDYVPDTHEAFTQINATSIFNAKMNIRMDSIGATWLIDSENNIIWHNGGTTNYNCYLGFDPNRQLAVVLLSNLPPNYRMPVTVLGVKLLMNLQKQGMIDK